MDYAHIEQTIQTKHKMPSGKKIHEAVPPSRQSTAYEKHRHRVKQAKSAIDVNPPESRPHVIFNAKRVQLERERQARIIAENFILVRKLNDIMHRKRSKEGYERLKWQDSRCLRSAKT